MIGAIHRQRSARHGMSFIAHMLLVLCLVLTAGEASLASSRKEAVSAAPEYEVKAGFLFNFAKFIEWPANGAAPNRTFTLGVIGEDPFEGALDALEGKMVGERTLTVKRFETINEIGGCDILFVAATEKTRFSEVLEAVEGHGVLTVGDIEPLARIGGVMNFKLIDHKVRFEINVDAAERAGLKISSQLLRLAELVKDTDGEGLP